MKKTLLLLLIIILLWSFYKINELNYQKHIQISQNYVQHPDQLPKKELALQTSFWFKNLRADLYWLETIQYIWWNAISSDYKEFLFIILDLVTELNPYFEHPYIIWQLLLPSYNERYESLNEDEQDKYIDQWITLWLKWIENFCDFQKIELIKNEYDLEKLQEEKYKNPCKTYTVPYYLAYIYYYYKNDPKTASLYYKIASANEETLGWAKIMAAIMQWKWWNREKSFYMFLNIGKYIDPQDTACAKFAWDIETIWNNIFKTKKVPLNGAIVKLVSDVRLQAFWEYLEENEADNLSDSRCSNYVNKAVRELNLAYIGNANNLYEIDHDWKPAPTTELLYNQWYIDYLPIDFQQYEDQGIIYKYNFDTKNYDYEMWN